MNDEKIGGISLDDIMAAAMDGLDDVSTTSQPNVAPSVPVAPAAPVAPIAPSAPVTPIAPAAPVAPSAPVAPIAPVAPVAPVAPSTPSTPIINHVIPVATPVEPAPVVQDDVYTIMGLKFVNVTNRLSPAYEKKVCDVFSCVDANRTAEAMQLAQELVDHNISSEVAWYVYAHAKEAWGDNALAQKGYEQAIAINPAFPKPYNDFGLLLAAQDKYEAAVRYFEKAVELDPSSEIYMGNAAYFTSCSDSYNAAIEKCKYYIDISAEKTFLQNILGAIYVALSKEYVVDVPDDFEDPDAGTTPGFISLEDIREVRNLCNQAKSLITLDQFKDDADMAESLLQACIEDCKLEPAHKKSFTIFHAVCVFIIYTFLTLVWGAPLALLLAIITVKADNFPRYMFNYVWCTGSYDPLKYVSDSFYRNHEILKAAKDGWNSVPSDSSSVWGDIFKEFFKSQIWFFKARIQFYKRFIKEKKEQKQNSIGTIRTDDINPGI